MHTAIIEVVTLRTLALHSAEAPRLETLTVPLLALRLLAATGEGLDQREHQVLLGLLSNFPRHTILLTE